MDRLSKDFDGLFTAFGHIVVPVLILFLSSIFSVGFVSCSNGNIDIVNVYHTVVFDYDDENSMPSMRLSAFVETSGDERRVGEVRLVHESSSMEWICESPRKIGGNGSSVWAGYTNFVPATGSVFPQGRYTFHYIDLAGEESQTGFSVVYPESISSTSASDLKSFFPNKDEYVAIYDRDSNLLYLGKRSEDWIGDADIKRDYGLAVKIRVCYRMNGGSVMCLLPEKDL